MRRRVGLAGLEQQNKSKEQYRQAGSDLAQAQLVQLRDQLETFKVHLSAFATTYRKDIRKDPAFRQRFQAMCARIGVDPLASNKGFWAEILGVGDFYYELAVQIIQVCMSTRAQNGGLMDVVELRRQLERMRAAGQRGNAQQLEISEDDILRAIKSLKSLGGFEVISVGQRKLVQSVPRELNVDHAAVLELAQQGGSARPCVTKRMLKERLQWDADRIERALNQLVRDGVCWVDAQADPVEYWIASLFEF